MIIFRPKISTTRASAPAKNTGKTIELTEQDQVCNVVGSAGDRPRCANSWQSFWEKTTQQTWPSTCSISERRTVNGNVYKCSKRIIGGHVYVKDIDVGATMSKFIIPLCSGCNNSRSLDYNQHRPRETNWTWVPKGALKEFSNTPPSKKISKFF